jgi:hypothetical protein
MALSNDTSKLRDIDDEMVEGYRVRFLEISDQADGQLSPGEQVEKAIEKSGENSGSVYYDGGSAFMSVSSPAPEDLTDFISEVQTLVRGMQAHHPATPQDEVK